MSLFDRLKSLLPRTAWYVPSWNDRNVFPVGQVINKTIISAALQSAHVGDLRYFAVLKQEMRASDPHLSSEVEKVEGFLTRSFEIQPAKVEGLIGSKATTNEAQLALDAAAYLREQFLLPEIQMGRAIKHAFSGLLDGVAGLQLVVDTKGRDEIVREFSPVATERFRYFPGSAILSVQPTDDQHDLVPASELQALGGLVLFEEEAHISSPARRGIMRRVLSAWLTKRYGFEYWALFVQLMGIPLRKGTYKIGDDKGRAELEAALRSAGSAPYVAFPDTTDVQFVSGLAGGAVNVHKDLVEHCEGLESKAITGSKQTSQTIRGEGSGQASSGTHERMLETRCEGYAARICEVFEAQAFRPMIARRFGADIARRITPKARIRIKGTEDLLNLSTAVKNFRDGGFTALALSDIYERGGLHVPAEGEETLADLIKAAAPVVMPQPGAPAEGNKPDGTPPAPPSPKPGEADTAPETLSAGSDLADTLKGLEAAAVKQSRGAGDSVVAPYADIIKQVLKEGGDLGHLANRVRHLEATNAGKTPKETADVIAAVCARALLTGYTQERKGTS